MQIKINSTYQTLKDIYPEQLFLTKKETAKVLGISESGILNYMNSNSLKLKSTKFGTSSKSAVRIKLSDLANFIDKLSSLEGEILWGIKQL